MVLDFPKLQGVIGYYYSFKNELKNVSQAIKDHYLPLKQWYM